MVSPESILFAVRALVRVGGAARAAYEQKVRDSDVIMPLPPQLDFGPLDHLRLTFDDARFRPLVAAGGPLAPHWDGLNQRPVDAAESRRVVLETAERIWQTELAKPRPQGYGGARREEEAGFLVLSQWAEGDAPPPPLARVVVALADVAIGYAAAHPSLLGVGSNGERLIVAMAENLRELLPDADDPRDWPSERWARFYFVERAATLFAHASLETLRAHPDLIVDERHFQDLLRNVLDPLVARLDEDPTRAPGLITLRDTLLGPMASAGLATLAAHPVRFLGRGFGTDRALGAVAGALLDEAAENGDLRAVFSEQGLIGLYRAALGVAVDRPELFVGDDAEPTERVRHYLREAARLLREAPSPYDADLAAALGVLALESAGEYASAALDPDDSWEALGQAALASFLSGVREGAAADDPRLGLAKLLSRDQLTEFARIFFDQTARTPGMLVGHRASPALAHLVAGVANAMTKRGALLLSGEDWLALAASAAREAARNPGLLFGLDGEGPDARLGSRAIELLLDAAADAFEDRGHAPGSVLFGETLRQAIELAIDAVVRNAEGATLHIDELGALVARVGALAATRPQRVGADAALALLAELAEPILESGLVAVVREDDVTSVQVADLTDAELMLMIEPMNENLA